jgi:hypothetical protein
MKDKKLSNYLKMSTNERREYLDLLVGLKMLEDHCKDSHKRINKMNLPSYEDISKHNKIYGSENSRYLN